MPKYKTVSRMTTYLNRKENREADDLSVALIAAGCVFHPIFTDRPRNLECELPSGERVQMAAGTHDELDRKRDIARRLGVTLNANQP